MKTRLSAALLFLALPGAALAANDVVVHRDPGCGCCEKWAQALRAKLGRTVVMRDDASRGALQRRAGMPGTLASCHSAMVDGYLIEGHVPVADIKRLLATRPVGVRGIAVAGMPIGRRCPPTLYGGVVRQFGPEGLRAALITHASALAGDFLFE